MRIDFRLIGTWWDIPLDTEDRSREAIERIVTAELGRADDHALARARMRRELLDAAGIARDNNVILMLLATELPGGAPMPLTVTVSQPEGLRMSPAIGEGSEEVLSVLEASLSTIDPAAHEVAVRREYGGGEVLRTHEVTHRELDEGAATVRELAVTYWYPVPESKQLMLVRFTTPLGDIPHVMLQYTDAIVRTSTFSRGDASPLHGLR